MRKPEKYKLNFICGIKKLGKRGKARTRIGGLGPGNSPDARKLNEIGGHKAVKAASSKISQDSTILLAKTNRK